MRNPCYAVWLLLFLLFSQDSLESASIVRGPYLQMGTPTNILFRLRTDTHTRVVIRYGTNSNLEMAYTNRIFATHHYVLLTGLQPDTLYYYAVADTNGIMAAGDTYYFKTAPINSKPTRIWVIGDSGTASLNPTNYHSQVVRDAYYKFTRNRYTDVWLMLGDNAYNSGEDHEYQAAVFEVYNPLLRQTTLWSTIGNHDAASIDPEIPYFHIFDFPTEGECGGVPSGTENYYSFDYGDIHFVCLDSEIVDRTPTGPMAQWLEADLASNSKKWLIAFWHTPPYSAGSNPSDENPDIPGRHANMRETFVAILERHGVDLVLNGHSHSYERSFLLDRHYERSHTITSANWVDKSTGRRHENGPYYKSGSRPHEGALYIVAGSSAWTGGGYLNHPAMCVSLDRLGSLVLDIDGNELDGTFVSHEGEILDRFAITKGVDPEPMWLSKLSIQQQNVILRWRSEANRNYIIQRSLDPTGQTWTNLTTVTAANRFTTWTNLIELPAAGKTFYRVRLSR